MLYHRLKRMCERYDFVCNEWRTERCRLSARTDEALCELELIYIKCIRELPCTLCVIEDLRRDWAKGVPFVAERYSLNPLERVADTERNE
jgi:hypothetical protein